MLFFASTENWYNIVYVYMRIVVLHLLIYCVTDNVTAAGSYSMPQMILLLCALIFVYAQDKSVILFEIDTLMKLCHLC